MVQSKQGTLNIAGTILSTGILGKITQIASFNFYNAAGYVLTIQKFQFSTASTITLGVYTKLAGETFEIPNSYYLADGDYYKVTPSIAGTDYNFIENIIG